MIPSNKIFLDLPYASLFVYKKHEHGTLQERPIEAVLARMASHVCNIWHSPASLVRAQLM